MALPVLELEPVQELVQAQEPVQELVQAQAQAQEQELVQAQAQAQAQVQELHRQPNLRLTIMLTVSIRSSFST